MMVLFLMILLIIGTVVLLFWNIMLLVAKSEHEMDAAHFAYRVAKEKHWALDEKYKVDVVILEKLDGLAYMWRKMRHSPKESLKKMAKLQKTMKKLDTGNFNGINFLVLPGYALVRMLGITGDQRHFQEAVTMYSNIKGREFAVHNARHLFASMLSCAIGGTGATMVLGVLLFAGGHEDIGLILAVAGPPLSLVLALVLYEDIKSKAKKRKEALMSDFAQAVTEIALLTSSGMEMFRAWREVCQSPERTGVLFTEMRQTIAEIDSGYQPAVALEGFIKRCGTKDTSRLGASILQNLTRGNEELSLFLAELSRDVWEERKHSARRLGEQARSKLIMPMGLIFLGILIMIGVSVGTAMGGMGF